MAVKPKTYKGVLVAIFFEDPDAPGTFLRPCALTQHSYSFTKDMGTVVVPFCDDPELPAWTEREANSFDFTGSGSGSLAQEAVDRLWEIYHSTDAHKARLYIGKPDDVVSGRYWEGMLHITQLDVTGNRGERAQVSINVGSDGEMTFNTITAG